MPDITGLALTDLCISPAQEKVRGVTVVKLLLLQGLFYYSVVVTHGLVRRDIRASLPVCVCASGHVFRCNLILSYLQNFYSLPIVPILHWFYVGFEVLLLIAHVHPLVFHYHLEGGSPGRIQYLQHRLSAGGRGQGVGGRG